MPVRLSCEMLLKYPLFRGLNETECRQIADVASTNDYGAGEVIVRQGERSQDLWVVMEGQCEVIRYRDGAKAGEPLMLAVLETPSHFGEMSFFHPAPHSASVRARTDVKLLRIARVDYDDMIHEGIWAAYKLAYNSIEGLADRLRRMDQWVAELMDKTPDDRVPEWTHFRDKVFKGWNL